MAKTAAKPGNKVKAPSKSEVLNNLSTAAGLSRKEVGAVLEALTAGADGFLDKAISPTGLMRALRGMSRGETPLPRELVTVVVDAVHDFEARDRARERVVVLSAREREVLALVATGARNRQIAQELSISEFTVKRHMQNILQKLDLSSRTAAGAFYRGLESGVTTEEAV